MPYEISPSLYLSNARRAHDVKLLQELQITRVIKLAGRTAQGPQEAYAVAGVALLNIDADDKEGYPMLSLCLAKCSTFIEKARKTNS